MPPPPLAEVGDVTKLGDVGLHAARGCTCLQQLLLPRTRMLWMANVDSFGRYTCRSENCAWRRIIVHTAAAAPRSFQTFGLAMTSLTSGAAVRRDVHATGARIVGACTSLGHVADWCAKLRCCALLESRDAGASAK
eukprot:365038-Chlamydomonas_euryale.AAC.3